MIKCKNEIILVETNFWMGFDDDHNDGLRIISSTCPNHQCCQNRIHGCDYIHDKQSLCADGRDYESVLCSKCLNGFSESLYSRKCVKCQYQEMNLIYLLLPTIFAFSLSLMLIAINTERLIKKDKKRQEEPNKLLLVLKSDNYQLMIKIMIFKCCLYYQQAISQLLYANSFNIALQPLSSLFDLSIISNSINGSDSCFIDGLTAKQKILFDLYTPIMIAVFIAVISIVTKTFTLKKRKINFMKTMICAYLIIMGKVLDVLFRLLTCTKIGNNTIHFYFAEEDCYGQTWVWSLVVLIIIIGIFVAICNKLKEMGQRKRRDRNHFLNIITSRYEPTYYYWELILFIRRIIIALFAVSEPNIYAEFIFIAILIFFSFLQYLHNPFKIDEANQMEFILINCFIFIVMIQLPLKHRIDSTIFNIVISLLIIYPYIWMMRMEHRKISKMDDDNEYHIFNEQSDLSDDEKMIDTNNYLLDNDNNDNKQEITEDYNETSEVELSGLKEREESHTVLSESAWIIFC